MAQTLEAQAVADGRQVDYVPAADIDGGDIIQMADGRAGVAQSNLGSGEQEALDTCGIYSVLKSTAVVIMDGAPVYWDHSARTATPVPPLVAGDRDFYLGVAIGDAALTDTTVKVAFNVDPVYALDLFRDGFDTTVVAAAGSPSLFNRGGSLYAAFDTTAEAQKLDMLSKRSFPVGSNWIVEGVFEVVTNGDADVVDINLGVADDTHASDADSIAESVFLHLDPGADLDIMVESDDGTTENPATDSTVNWAVGTAFHFAIDGRDETDIKFYVNGVRVASGTTFTLADATGPLKLLAHIEKSANDSPGAFHIDALTVRIAQ